MSLYTKNKVKKVRYEQDRKDNPRAILRNLRVAPRKMRILADMIRGKSIEEAMALLTFTPKSGAKILQKLVMSAVYNAENQGMDDSESLKIERIFVDDGPIMKWRRPRSRGRAFRINKRTSHITVIVGEF
ncbi:MAG: 50S ribosomal protein L22 [Deltaproteobacteria bacterium]|nr:50S ribosomal protein L22 [Deltaproteobacteria bacterium]